MAASETGMLPASLPSGADPTASVPPRPWIPYTEVVELTELGNAYPTALVVHVYEEQHGEGRHPDARAIRYLGTKTYVPIWEKEVERQARLDAIGEKARHVRERLLSSIPNNDPEWEDARIHVRELEELVGKAIREARA